MSEHRERIETTFRAIGASWKSEFSVSTQYRADFFLGIFVSGFWLAVSASPVIILSSNGGIAGGWTVPELLFLLAVWYLMDAVMWILVFPNLSNWAQLVQSGDMDVLLVKPLVSVLWCSLRTLNVRDLPKLLLALGLMTYTMVIGGRPGSIGGIFLCGICVLCAGVIMWAVAVLVNCRLLSQVQFDGMFILHAIHNLARVPTPLYGFSFQIVLTAVVPVAFISTIPTQMFFGSASPWLALASILIAVMFAAIAVRAWNREVERYSGAMG